VLGVILNIDAEISSDDQPKELTFFGTRYRLEPPINSGNGDVVVVVVVVFDTLDADGPSLARLREKSYCGRAWYIMNQKMVFFFVLKLLTFDSSSNRWEKISSLEVVYVETPTD